MPHQRSSMLSCTCDMHEMKLQQFDDFCVAMVKESYDNNFGQLLALEYGVVQLHDLSMFERSSFQ